MARDELTPGGRDLSPSAQVELASERLHDARLAGDKSAVQQALNDLQNARQLVRRDAQELVDELDVAGRIERLKKRTQKTSIMEHALRGDFLWGELVARLDSFPVEVNIEALGISNSRAAKDVLRNPERLRLALYSQVTNIDYFELRASTRDEVLVAARAHDAQESARLQDYLSRAGYLPTGNSARSQR